MMGSGSMVNPDSREWPLSEVERAHASAPARHLVLDASGQVAEWVRAGRGVDVWRMVDLSHPGVGTLAFTPALDAAGGEVDAGAPGAGPGWRYKWVERIASADAPARLAFYYRGDVIGQWSDTTAGWRAAWRIVGEVERASADYGRWAKGQSGMNPGSSIRRKVGGRSTLIDARGEWSGPSGTFAQTWTVERLTYRTDETVAYPLAPATLRQRSTGASVEGTPVEGGEGRGAPVDAPAPPMRPLATIHTVGIVVWFAHLADNAPAPLTAAGWTPASAVM